MMDVFGTPRDVKPEESAKILKTIIGRTIVGFVYRGDSLIMKLSGGIYIELSDKGFCLLEKIEEPTKEKQ